MRPEHLPGLSEKKVDRSKLGRRYRKTVRRLVRETLAGLAETLAEERRAEVAHQTRRSCKRLRYTLELARDPKLTPLLQHLATLQDHIGAVHDLDVTIARLHAEGLTRLERSLKTARHDRYRALIRFGRQGTDPLAALVGSL